MSSIEYLYWYEGDALKHHVGNYGSNYEACVKHEAIVYFCYSIHYQFKTPWFCLNSAYEVTEYVQKVEDVPPDIRALHLLIYRGDYALHK